MDANRSAFIEISATSSRRAGHRPGYAPRCLQRLDATLDLPVLEKI